MEKSFEDIRNQWCIDQGFEGYMDYSDSLSIGDGEYEYIAELYADQFKPIKSVFANKPLSCITDEHAIEVARLAHQSPAVPFKVRKQKDIIYVETDFDRAGIKHFISIMPKYGTVCAQLCFSKTDDEDYKQYTVNIGQISISSKRPVPYIAIVDFLRSKNYQIPKYFEDANT